MLYSVVHLSRDAEYHEETVMVTDDKDKAKRFAKRYAKKRDVYLSDENAMLLYAWRGSRVVNRTRLEVTWRKER